ncbi:DUF6484 domain-containing protein [Corallococcus sicarius]|uniref:DUF6484 domain-containing protein n=1 Tax=Corallococcus sicarius TaxID=2316726 RepID=A0A3A8NUW9_9BACT|nr:DUF6484 domain-containing protein [Corallococcus sicarius]RKH44955.1 hypothetical protein D7X12_09195 [Corallococcus sicarius]
MSKKSDVPEPGPGTRTPEPILGSREGWAAGIDSQGRLLVDFEDNPLGQPVPAKLAVVLDAQARQDVVASRQRVVLLFEKGDPRLPFLMALLHEPSETPLLDALLEPAPVSPRLPAEARVDGKRVVLEGKDEVILQCGEASITLRRNGKIVIKGVTVETRARGAHRIKAGTVDIN